MTKRSRRCRQSRSRPGSRKRGPTSGRWWISVICRNELARECPRPCRCWRSRTSIRRSRSTAAALEPATAGELRLSGRPIGPPGPDRGMMFQELSLFPWLTAIENVAWPLEMKGLPKRERTAKAAEYLDLVHLSRFADVYPGQLSGGMKQRVALARLFALDPEIMLMDEPFGALDSQTRELLQEELQSIWRRAR